MEPESFVISGFCREVAENCAASSGNFLPTFRDNLSVPSLGADTALLRFFTAHTLPCKNSVWSNRLSFGFFNPENGTVRLSRNVCKKLTATRCVITQKSAVLEPEVSLPHSQASGWARSFQPISWRFFLILSSHLHLYLPSTLFQVPSPKSYMHPSCLYDHAISLQV